MANLICKSCGAEANSKCPYCRTVFPLDQYEAMLSNVFKRQLKPSKYEDDECQWLEISWYTNEDLAGALEELRLQLNRMADPINKNTTSIEQYACDHAWVFKPGHKSSIGCGHGG